MCSGCNCGTPGKLHNLLKSRCPPLQNKFPLGVLQAFGGMTLSIGIASGKHILFPFPETQFSSTTITPALPLD